MDELATISVVVVTNLPIIVFFPTKAFAVLLNSAVLRHVRGKFGREVELVDMVIMYAGQLRWRGRWLWHMIQYGKVCVRHIMFVASLPPQLACWASIPQERG